MEPNLFQNIDKIIEATKNKKIQWVRTGDNTFYWLTTSSQIKEVNLVIQGYLSPANEINDILFRLWDTKNKVSIMDIEWKKSDFETKQKLEKLFYTVKEYFLTQRLDILSDLLKDL